MYLGYLEAFRARLEGKPFDYVPSLGAVEQLLARGSDVALNVASVREFAARSTRVNLGDEAVAIVLFDLMGTDVFRANPTLTFECIHIDPDYTRWTGGNIRPKDGSEQVKALISGSTRGAMGGEDFSGQLPRAAKLRPIMMPYNILIEVRAYSKDPLISLMLTGYVMEKLPPRGAIRVPFKDGTYKALRVEQKDFTDQDKKIPAGVGAPGLIAEYLKIWTYNVRGFLDNTDLWTMANLVRRKDHSLSPLEGVPSGG